jgi:hypothetical protein
MSIAPDHAREIQQNRKHLRKRYPPSSSPDWLVVFWDPLIGSMSIELDPVQGVPSIRKHPSIGSMLIQLNQAAAPQPNRKHLEKLHQHWPSFEEFVIVCQAPMGPMSIELDPVQGVPSIRNHPSIHLED